MADINTNLADLTDNANRIAVATSAIASAITAKGGTVTGGDGLEDFASDIATIPSGGGTSATRKDVNFYDYDGTIVNSYTAAEFANLSAFPSNPSHDGLTAQGWNWSLSDAKTYVASYGKLDIGQMYVTSDGKTRLYITLTEGRTSPVLSLQLFQNSELDIDWGDGSTHSTFTSTVTEYQSERHNYASTGDYVIVITVVSGSFNIASNATLTSRIISNGDNTTYSPDRVYAACLNKVELGLGITSLATNAFCNCNSLSTITIPYGVVFNNTNLFIACSNLKAITIPNSVTSIVGSAFESCYSLSIITIPNSVTSIDSSAFKNCSSLSSITIPDSVTSIGQAAFTYCYLIHATIPNGVTSIGKNAFNHSSFLSSITIPSSVTSIGTTAFSDCYSLATITIDNSEGSISGSPWGATTTSPTSTQIIWTG